jgi:glyoxylase-like metal-dependent hydrolase (beta-lactamase superfamily II)
VSAASTPRIVQAGNRGPFTLGGTRTFLIGEKITAVIDPGPDVEEHARALFHALAGAMEVRIILTHGHADHAGSARILSEAFGAPVLGAPSMGFLPLKDQERVPTDEGDLISLTTPGHTRDHVAFYWPRAKALFAGDMVLGRGTTTWLGEYPGCVADYLASLQRVLDLAPDIVYPAHGPAIRSPRKTLETYRDHRLARLEQVQAVRKGNPGASVEEILQAVYGENLPARTSVAARRSIQVMLHHLGLDP